MNDDLQMASAPTAERYLTEDLPGIGGTIKEQVEDFVVEELPLYQPAGTGEHTFFEIRKTGLSTFEAVRRIAQALRVAPSRIGYAGLKDAHAVASQTLSVHGVPPEKVLALNVPGIEVSWARCHPRKLKIGHLRGNRFTLRVRGTSEGQLPACSAIVSVLAVRGVPNRFGPQRFGTRGNSSQLGRMLVQRDARAFMAAFLGCPHDNESHDVQEARRQFEAGQWSDAIPLFPGNMADERRALQTLIQTNGDYQIALASVSKRLKTFLVSAFQSALFNRVLNARLSSLDRVFPGDLAMKHPGRSVFLVEDETVEQPRVGRFEISPTGPIFGYKMTQASGRQGELEREILAAEGLALEDFRIGGGIRARGERRALRFALHEPEIWYDDGIMLRFWLPRGSYATTVLAEITKAEGPMPSGRCPAPD